MGELSIAIVDLIIAVVVLVSASYAAWRGLMRETLSIFSFAVSVYLTLLLFPSFSPIMRDFIGAELIADLAAFIAIFVITLVPLSYIAFQFAETVRRTDIGSVDRVLGFVFGVGRGLVIVGFAFIVFSWLVPPATHPGWLTQARFYPAVVNTSEVLLSLLPPSQGFTIEDLAIAPRPVAPQPAPVPAPAPQAAQNQQPPADDQTYGADERAALDRLIETTGAP
jgi:membrane protein required for colicin V production